MPEVALLGCRTTPLLSYLKALGVLRHVAREDTGTRLRWDRCGHAVLLTELNEDDLLAFFLERYEPSPITSPWNGGSGYFAKDNRDAIRTIESSTSPRLAAYRQVIAAAQALLTHDDSTVPDGVADKKDLITRWRSGAPDAALEWIDATMALTDEGPTMSPLLGTGGNDGRFEFSNNFMQRLITTIPGAFGSGAELEAISRERLTRALLGRGNPRLDDSPVGMFDPGGAGLPNSSSSTREGALLNGWDFVLMMEGLLLFGGSVGRHLSGGGASFPFTLRGSGVTRVGRSLSGDADANTRGETWLPVWHRFASLASVGRILSEGRLQDGREQARSGRTAGRAAASLGVERGINSFERVVFAERFGRNYVAVPAGRVDVQARPETMELLRGADAWLAAVRRIDSAAVRRRVSAVESAEGEVVRHQGALRRWLLALAELQLAVSRRPRSRDARGGVRPLGGLPVDLLQRIDDGSAEHVIACALAGVGRQPDPTRTPPGLRSLLEPVAPTRDGGFAWHGERGLGRGVGLADPERLLVALAVWTAELSPPPPSLGCPLWAVQRFLNRETDDATVVRLAFAYSLCPTTPRRGPSAPPDGYTDRLYALTRLVTGLQREEAATGDPSSPRPAPQAVRALAAGRSATAAHAAVRRLRADHRSPLAPLAGLRRKGEEARRVAAALAIPLSSDAHRELERIVLAPRTGTLSPQPEGAAG